MDRKEIMRKAEANEGMTVEEIMEYRKLVPPKKQVYGKYGTLAKKYLEEENPAKLWALGGDLPKYLHDVDEAAERMYDVMYEKLSENEEFKWTGEYMTDVRRENALKHRIEEEILSEIVYVD